MVFILYFLSVAKNTESPVETAEEKREESGDQNDVWQKLKDFAGYLSLSQLCD